MWSMCASSLWQIGMYYYYSTLTNRHRMNALYFRLSPVYRTWIQIMRTDEHMHWMCIVRRRREGRVDQFIIICRTPNTFRFFFPDVVLLFLPMWIDAVLACLLVKKSNTCHRQYNSLCVILFRNLFVIYTTKRKRTYILGVVLMGGRACVRAVFLVTQSPIVMGFARRSAL